MKVTIAHAAPFEGAPKITVPSVYGASPDRPIMWRISVLGQRPLTITAEGLPCGLTLEGNTVTGVTKEGEYTVTLTAENALGRDTKAVKMTIKPEGLGLTPLLGFTTWNAFDSKVSQAAVEKTAEELISSGLAEYGYSYVNIDSGWQHEYGGEFDAVQPNPKFPDMKALTDKLHALGLKCGIYSTPMLTAWGCPAEYKSIPGCTRGEANILDCTGMGGIGVEHCEANNARQWAAWGIDYLKYDWAHTDPVNAELMRKALRDTDRDFMMCVTVRASLYYAHYWNTHVNSWRCNSDTFDTWNSILRRFADIDAWRGLVKKGHFYDLDMLAIGPMEMNGGKSRITEDEELFAYTVHSFFPSPIQLSCRLDEMTEFERDLFSNEEIIAINQDALCDYPYLKHEYDYEEMNVRVYERKLEGGDRAIAVFNFGENTASHYVWLDQNYEIRNVWEKRDLGMNSIIRYSVPPHSAKVYRLTPSDVPVPTY